MQFTETMEGHYGFSKLHWIILSMAPKGNALQITYKQ